jgi:hypothetical protein
MRPEQLQQPTPEQQLVAMGAAMGAEVALNVEGREQQEQILRDAHAAFVGAVARVQNEAGEVEVADPTTGQIVGTVRAIGPGSSSRLLPR